MRHFQIWLSEMVKVLGGLPLKWVHVILHLTPLCLQLKTSNISFLPLHLPASDSFNPHFWTLTIFQTTGMAEKCEKEEIVTLIQGDRNVNMGKKNTCAHLLSWMLMLQYQSYFSRLWNSLFFFIYSTGSVLPKNFHTLLKSPLELHLIEKNKHTLKFLISLIEPWEMCHLHTFSIKVPPCLISKIALKKKTQKLKQNSKNCDSHLKQISRS